MKAVILEEFGGSDKLKFVELPIPIPQDHEVLINIAYTAVNPVDWKIREGLLKSRLPHEFPVIPGWDAAGTIAAVGKNVHDLKVNDAVYAYCRKPVVHDGTYAEYITFDAKDVALRPKSISCAEAASIPLAALTAWQALFEAYNLKGGEKVLIHAGSGGVGGFAIQFAKYIGATVYTTCSTSNVEYVKSLGADVVIDYTKTPFDTTVKDMDLVFDTLGGETLLKSLSVLKKGGTVVSIVQQLDEAIATEKGVKFRYHFVHPDGKELARIAELIDRKAIKVPHIQLMNLSDFKEAQDLSKSGHTRGKLVLKV